MKLIIIAYKTDQLHAQCVENAIKLWGDRGDIIIITYDEGSTFYSDLYNENDRISIVQVEEYLGSGHAVLNALYNFGSLSEKLVITKSSVFISDESVINQLIDKSSNWDLMQNYAVSVTQVDNPKYEVITYPDDSEIYYQRDFRIDDFNKNGWRNNEVYIFESTKLLETLSKMDVYLWQGTRYITYSARLSLSHTFSVLCGNIVPSKHHVWANF